MAARKPANAAYLTKDPSEVHEGFAAYIAKTTGHEVPVGDVALVQRLYPIYLKTPEVVKAKEAAAARKEREAREREERKQQRLKDRLARIEEQRLALLAELGEGSEEPEPEPVAAAPKKKTAAKARLKVVAEEPEPEPEPVEVTLSDDEFVETGGDDSADEDDWDAGPSDESDEEDW